MLNELALWPCALYAKIDFRGLGRNTLKKNTYNITLLSMFIAVAVIGRLAFAMIPQVKPVLAIIIISGICMGAKNGFIVGMLTAFLSNFFFGQGPWTPWQMFSMGIVGLLAGLIFYNKRDRINIFIVCIFGGLSSLLIYSVINNFSSMIMMQANISILSFLTYTFAGLSMDITLSVSTVLFLCILLKPMLNIMEIMKEKYLVK